MSDQKKTAQAPAPTFLKSVAKASDARTSMKGTGKMCSYWSYGS